MDSNLYKCGNAVLKPSEYFMAVLYKLQAPGESFVTRLGRSPDVLLYNTTKDLHAPFVLQVTAQAAALAFRERMGTTTIVGALVVMLREMYPFTAGDGVLLTAEIATAVGAVLPCDDLRPRPRPSPSAIPTTAHPVRTQYIFVFFLLLSDILNGKIT
jgi:hypothetical protein